VRENSDNKGFFDITTRAGKTPIFDD